MKKTLIVLGFTSAIAAAILAATPLFNFAFAPIILAFVCGLLILNISKKQNTKTKTIQYIFLLVIISLSLTIYKSVINTSKLDDTLPKDNSEQLEQQDQENSKDSNDILDNKVRVEKI